MFLNPFMLAGIAGVAVPVVLHLLSRARYRSVDWGAMMFLVDADAWQRQSHRLKQLILLAVRMGIIALLALAMSRPAVSTGFSGLPGEAHATVALIVDVSASMSYEDNGRTRLDGAREMALQVLSTLGRGDRAAVLAAGSPASDAPPAPTADLQSVAARLAQLKPTAGEADFALSLAQAMDMLDKHERLNREIYVICDKQSVSWKHIDSAFAAAWTHRQGTPMRLTVLLIGGEEADNVAVESIDLLNPPAIRDQAADVEVTLHNYGAVPRASLPVMISTGTKPLSETLVSLGPNSSATVRATARFATLGSHSFTASIKSTGLSADDHLDAAVDVTDPIRTLIVSSEPVSAGLRSQTGLVRLSLSPFKTTGRTGPDPSTVEIVPPEKWSSIDFPKFDVVVLSNLERFSQQQARDLEQFVYGGGGVLLLPGNVSRADEYNAALYRGGAGILPAKLQPATTVDGSASTSLLGMDLSHNVFRFLRGRPDPIPSAVVARYFPAVPRQPDARVLATYASGKPFLVEAVAGRGRVLLVTTALDADWTTLPLSSFYLPFVQSCVRYLASAGNEDRNVAPDEPLLKQFDQPVEPRGRLDLPDGSSEEVAFTRMENRDEFRFTRTGLPGIYRLHSRSGGKDGTLHFVVRAPREESNLTPLSQARRDEIANSLQAQVVDTRKPSASVVIGHDRSRRELWGLLLGGVFLLAMLELMLTRWWTGGPG